MTPASSPWSSEERPRDAVQRRLEAARAESRGLPGELAWVRLEAPVVAPEALLQRFPDRDCILWSPPSGPLFAGIDIAQSLTGTGPGRFAEVQRRGAELWNRLRAPGSARGGLDAPRLFGGFSFRAQHVEATSPWARFGAARAVLPRITYAAGEGRAVLCLAVERAELERGAESEHVQLLQHVYETLLGNPELEPGSEARPESRTEPEPAEFQGRVLQLIEAIGRGVFEKVVTAREVQLSFAAALDPVATVSALSQQAPECSRFLFRWGPASFIGATPERLVHKRGRRLATEALAGSIDARADSPEHRLAASLKDLEEHEPVVAAIQRALAPLCERLELPSRPAVRRLKHLLHLCTPIQGVLRGDTHVLSIVERLHPTPAVGGVPTAAALDWIARHEPFDRGWYAGAVGWFDAQGDGDFNVALRSGLISDRQARLYAGAGIVRGSVAEAEYAETTPKLAAVLGSLRARS
jgi:isochorismate synthase